MRVYTSEHRRSHLDLSAVLLHVFSKFQDFPLCKRCTFAVKHVSVAPGSRGRRRVSFSVCYVSQNDVISQYAGHVMLQTAPGALIKAGFNVHHCDGADTCLAMALLSSLL